MKKYLISISLFVVLSACEHKNTDEKLRLPMANFAPPPSAVRVEVREEKSKDADDVNSDKKAAEKNSNEVTDTAKKIIKDGDIRFQTIDLKLTKRNIVAALKGFGGYVADESETNNGDNNQREFNLKIRVPSKNFDKFLEALSGDADRIDSKNIRIRDVTTEFIDVNTQIKNKKILESRYQALMAKATKMADLLEIEDKLTEIRTDIESTQGQLNYLSSQIAYSTLDITFYTKQSGQVNSSSNDFGYKFKTALADGWIVVQEIFFALITLWPFITGVLIIYWFFKSWRKRKKAKETA